MFTRPSRSSHRSPSTKFSTVVATFGSRVFLHWPPGGAASWTDKGHRSKFTRGTQAPTTTVAGGSTEPTIATNQVAPECEHTRHIGIAKEPINQTINQSINETINQSTFICKIKNHIQRRLQKGFPFEEKSNGSVYFPCSFQYKPKVRTCILNFSIDMNAWFRFLPTVSWTKILL